MEKPFRWIILFLTLSTPLFSFAQNNYLPGYAVDLKNDTLKGYINYREWRNNPMSFSFKRSLTDHAVQNLTVKNTKAVAITNLEYYKTFNNLRISKGNNDAGSLTAIIDSSYHIDTVFLKVVTRGKNVSLYSLADNVKIHFYIEDNKDDRIKELDLFSYLNDATIVVVNAFRKQLTVLALTYRPGDTKLIEQAQRANYAEEDIKAFIYQINGGENVLFKQEKVSAIRFFAGAGVKSNTLTFGGAYGPYPSGTNRTSIFPVLSAGADFIINKKTNRITFRAEATVTNNTYNFNNYVSPNLVITSSSLDVKQLNISVIPQVIYNFYSRKDFKAFIDAGLSCNFSFYNNYSYVANYFDQTSTTQKKFPPFEKTWPSYPLKAGVMLNNKLEIYGTYWLSSSVINALYYSAVIKSYQVGVNYIF